MRTTDLGKPGAAAHNDPSNVRVPWAMCAALYIVSLGFISHFCGMFITAVLWSDPSYFNTVGTAWIVVSTIAIFAVVIYIAVVFKSGKLRAPSKPVTVTLLLRFLGSIAICSMTIIACIGLLNLALEQFGNKHGLLIGFTIWFLTFAPMVYFMIRALKGVHYNESSALSYIEQYEVNMKSLFDDDFDKVRLIEDF